MQLLPEAGSGRPLALILAAIVLVLVYLVGFHWFLMSHIEIAGAMGDLRDAERRFRETAAERPAVEAQLARVREYEQGNQMFLREASFDLAAAALTSRLKQLVTEQTTDAQRCQVISNSNFRPREVELYQRVTVKVRMRCTMEDFAAVLHELESGSPALFVEALNIYKQQGYRGPAGKQTAGFLDVRFDLSGYLRSGTRS